MDTNHIVTAFSGGAIPTGVAGRGDIRFEYKKLGELLLPTGEIVACDPICYYDAVPFVRRVPCGTYAVDYSVASLAVTVGIAFLRLNFSTAPVVRWELAERQGTENSKYDVDSATCCFMDRKTLDLLDANMEEDAFYDGFPDQLMSNGDCGSYLLDEAAGLNIVYCQSGFGDGAYNSYFGLDASDQAVRLVTDFDVVRVLREPRNTKDPLARSVSAGWDIDPPWWKFWG